MGARRGGSDPRRLTRQAPATLPVRHADAALDDARRRTTGPVGRVGGEFCQPGGTRAGEGRAVDRQEIAVAAVGVTAAIASSIREPLTVLTNPVVHRVRSESQSTAGSIPRIPIRQLPRALGSRAFNPQPQPTTLPFPPP